ncbi:MAG: hypothetical protein AAF518_11650 [Spirochaetota bacterium]
MKSIFRIFPTRMHYCRMKEGYLITGDKEEEVTEGKKTIRVIPLYKWLLTFAK